MNPPHEPRWPKAWQGCAIKYGCPWHHCRPSLLYECASLCDECLHVLGVSVSCLPENDEGQKNDTVSVIAYVPHLPVDQNFNRSPAYASKTVNRAAQPILASPQTTSMHEKVIRHLQTELPWVRLLTSWDSIATPALHSHSSTSGLSRRHFCCSLMLYGYISLLPELDCRLIYAIVWDALFTAKCFYQSFPGIWDFSQLFASLRPQSCTLRTSHCTLRSKRHEDMTVQHGNHTTNHFTRA